MDGAWVLTGLIALAGLLLYAFWIVFREPKSALSDSKNFEYSWAHVPLKNDPTNHLPVHYRLEGDSTLPVLVLIHGLGANINCWRRLIPEVKTDFRVLALDLPGFGLTPNPESYFGESPENLGDLVIDLLEHLKITEPVYVMGNSLGGLLTLAMLERIPTRIRKILLINPALSRKLVF